MFQSLIDDVQQFYNSGQQVVLYVQLNVKKMRYAVWTLVLARPTVYQYQVKSWKFIKEWMQFANNQVYDDLYKPVIFFPPKKYLNSFRKKIDLRRITRLKCL